MIPTATRGLLGAFALGGDTLSHAASVETAYVSAPPLVFVTLILAGSGFAPPACAENERPAGVTDSAGGEGFTVTDAEFDFVGSATLVAVTVTVWSTVTIGAWNSPVLVMLPAVARQVTETSLQLLTVVENCSVPSDVTVAVTGVTDTAIGRAAVVNV